MIGNKKVTYINKAYLFLLFLLLIILDQTSKIYISKFMIINSFSDKNILPFFNIVFVRNTGISFGLFSDGGLFNRYFFSMFSILVGLILFFISIISKNKLVSYALILIASGAFGNAVDRIYFGGVIDFIDIFIYNFHWPAFNFADIYITLGVIVLIIDSLLYDR